MSIEDRLNREKGIEHEEIEESVNQDNKHSHNYFPYHFRFVTIPIGNTSLDFRQRIFIFRAGVIVSSPRLKYKKRFPYRLGHIEGIFKNNDNNIVHIVFKRQLSGGEYRHTLLEFNYQTGRYKTIFFDGIDF